MHALILLLSVNGTVHAGLFGPSNFDECVAKYAVSAQVDDAASGATGWCRRVFPREGQPASDAFMVKRAQCVLDQIGDVKADAAYQQLVAMCVRTNAEPPRPPLPPAPQPPTTDEYLQQLRSKCPELDPGSAAANSYLIKEVADRTILYVQNGNSAVASIAQSVKDFDPECKD